MAHTVTGKSVNRPCGKAAPFLAWRLAAAFVVMTGAGLQGARGQDALRWKFRDGDVLKYTTEQTTVMTVKLMGKERKQKRGVTTTYTWSVKAVSETGEADIIQRIERLAMKVDAPPFLPMEYDSSSANNSIPEPFEQVVRQLKAALGAEFSFKMKPTGEIVGIKIPEATLKKLREGLPDDQGERDAFSEQALKDMVSQTSPPAFPEGPLEPGKSWSSKPSRVPLPSGTLVLDRSFTFRGPDPQNPKLMIIAMEGKVALEPGGDSSAKIRSQDGKGSLTFDAESGRLVSSRGTQKTEMVVVEAGQERDETTETNAVMTLVP
jgi:uncharacterized protein DUF6263